MTDKTSSGRSKNTACPHCDRLFYSVHTLNVHIAYKHPGERTVIPGAATKRLTPYKKPKAKAKPQPEARAKPEKEVNDYGSEEEDDPY